MKRSFPFSFRSWRRNEAEEHEEEDLETGVVNAAEFSRQSAGPSAADRQTEGASSSRQHEEGSPKSPCRGSPRSSEDSQTATEAILGAIGRLGSAALPRNPNLACTCLICLESLSQEEFENGEAIVLDCECRGEVAMRHRSCAEKWSRVKGNRTCDICKALVKNLPDVPPQLPDSATAQGAGFDENGEMLRNNAMVLSEQAPSGADVVFDCIRVTWVAMIVSILFFNMDIANALWTGVIFGLGYTIFVRAMYRHQLRQLMREQALREGGESPPAHHPVVGV
jgi:hypothetical protein